MIQIVLLVTVSCCTVENMAASDKQIGQNLQQLRGARSQKDIAEAMTEHGWKWSQTTVWSIEQGKRPLRLAEAEDLVRVLDLQSIVSITAPAGEFEYLVTQTQLQQAQRELVLQAEKVLRLQRQMVEELNQMPTSTLDEGAVRGLEWDLRETPVELVYDLAKEHLPMVRSLADQGGPFGTALLEGIEKTELTRANDVQFTFGEASDGEHPTAR